MGGGTRLLLSRRSRKVDRSLRDRNSGHGVTRLQFAQPNNKSWLNGSPARDGFSDVVERNPFQAVVIILVRSGLLNTLRKTCVPKYHFAVQQRDQDFGEMDFVSWDLEQIPVEHNQVGGFADFDRTGFGLFKVHDQRGLREL